MVTPTSYIVPGVVWLAQGFAADTTSMKHVIITLYTYRPAYRSTTGHNLDAMTSHVRGYSSLYIYRYVYV